MKTDAADLALDLDLLARELRCNEAWLDASHAWLGDESGPEPRPLSLASLDALRLMGIDFTTTTFDTPEIALYRWLHTAPLPAVKAALWTGEWRYLLGDPAPLAEEIVAAFRAERERLAGIIAAATVSIRPKPRPKNDDTPPDVLPPTLGAFRACTIAAALKAELEFVRWHLPLGQALQVYHWALWESGRWTVRPGKEATREELEDLTPLDADD